MPHLVDTVQELNENRTAVAHVRSTEMTTSSAKHVAERQPIFLDQDLEPIYCSVIRVYQKLDHR